MVDGAGRFAEYSLSCGEKGSIELLLDFSRQRVNHETIRLLVDLARARHVEARRAALFDGEIVNLSEARAALHPDARAPEPQDPILARERERVSAFAARFRSGQLPGAQRQAAHADREYRHRRFGPRRSATLLGIGWCRHAAGGFRLGNGRRRARTSAVREAPPEETLFVVCSKSFTTKETLANAYAARHWLVSRLGAEAPARHFAAVSSNADAMSGWGIRPAMQFRIPEAIGGRYSLWSSAGLSAWLVLGRAKMAEFLAGGAELDRHFLAAPAERNVPVLMAMFALWNQAFLGCSAHLVLAYDTRLKHLPAYLQQLELESLGKSADAQGRPLAGEGVAALLGGAGSSAQHSIMQWAQQGRRALSADFIATREAPGAYPKLHAESLHQMLAQAEALARGLPQSASVADPLAAHKALPGGRSSSVFLLDRLDARRLGALIALYEHKVFVQAVLLGVNPFDQWGVEHAKRLAADDSSRPPLAALLKA